SRPQQPGKGLVELVPGFARQLCQPFTLLGVWLVRQRDSEFCRNRTDLTIQLSMVVAKLCAYLLDDRASSSFLRQLPGRDLPQAGQADPYEHVAIRGCQRIRSDWPVSGEIVLMAQDWQPRRTGDQQQIAGQQPEHPNRQSTCRPYLAAPYQALS